MQKSFFVHKTIPFRSIFLEKYFLSELIGHYQLLIQKQDSMAKHIWKAALLILGILTVFTRPVYIMDHPEVRL